MSPGRPRRAPVVLALAVALVVAPALAGAQDAPESTGVRPDGSSAAAPADAPGSQGTPEVEVVAQGLNAPTVIAFGPDGTLYFGEWKTGEVKKLPSHETVLDVGEVAWGNERGFVGLAVDSQGYFYTFHTENKSNPPPDANPTYGDQSPFVNQLIRWTPDGEKDKVLLADLPGGDWHNSGRIWVDPRDDTLWVSYGDTNEYEVAQDLDDLRGSILHMDRDGNPVAGNVAEDSLIYSYGHRQPYGFAVDPLSGRVMAAENMDKKNDEVNAVEPGGNYGWPECEGPCATPRDGFTEPVVYYESTIGPSTGIFLGGQFYFGDFNYGHLHRVYEHEGEWFDEIVYAADAPPILHLVTGPEGDTIYYSAWNHIVKLTFPDVDAAPVDGGDGSDGSGGTDGSDGGTDGTDGTGGDGGTDPNDDDGEDARGFVPSPAVTLVAVAVALAVAVAGRARRGDRS